MLCNPCAEKDGTAPLHRQATPSVHAGRIHSGLYALARRYMRTCATALVSPYVSDHVQVLGRWFGGHWLTHYHHLAHNHLPLVSDAQVERGELEGERKASYGLVLSVSPTSCLPITHELQVVCRVRLCAENAGRNP